MQADEAFEQRIMSLIERYRALDGAAMPMLYAVQRSFGYIPGAAVPVIARLLDVSCAEIHGLVSFYHDFREEPAGRTLLRLCRAESCRAQGAETLSAIAQERLGIDWHETTPDGAVTLEPVYCLSLCAASPCAVVNGKSVVRLDREKLAAILDEAGVPTAGRGR